LKFEIKILGAWLALMLVLRLTFYFPHRHIDDLAYLNAGVQLLLFILTLLISINSRGSQRYVFLNFALFFAWVIPMMASSFVGRSLFLNSKYAIVFFHTYVNKFGLNFLLIVIIVFAVIDYAMGKRTIIFKYTASIISSAAILMVFYSSFLINPLNIYRESQYVLLKKMQDVEKAMTKQFNRTPTDEELAAAIQAQTTSPGPIENTATPLDQSQDVHELRPYLEKGGETSVFWRPLDWATIYVSAIASLMLVLFMVLHYRSERTSHAYLDKILSIFLILCIVNILHTLGEVYSNSSPIYLGVFRVSHFITLSCSMVMVYVLDLKLRFALSVAGKYYEETLIESSLKISRWRDEIDNVILNSFFKRNKFARRLADLNKSIEIKTQQSED
jgi:hypothetical protein